MSKFIAILLSLSGLSSVAMAHAHHTENVCGQVTKDLCLHLGFDELPQPNTAFNFVIDIVDKTKAKETTDLAAFLAIELPNGDVEYVETEVTPLDVNHWDAKSPAFTGKIWGVLVAYTYKGQSENVLVPLK